MQIIRGKKLKQIFSDHWPDFSRQYKHLLSRPAISKNIAKMLTCGTEAMGFHQWKCPKCQFEKKVFHTCKSRFCPSCGIAQTKRWKEQFNVLFADTSYKHIIFHPPSEFRDYFKIGKTPYFHMLFTTAHQALAEWYVWKGYLPGIMAVIHTFGRDEKFTPHIHILVTCGGLNATRTQWITVSNGFLPHDFLRKHFREHFLANMRELWKTQLLENVPFSRRFMFTPLYQNKLIQTVLGKIWFVWIGKKIEDAFFAVGYVARYTKRPPIAEGNIVAYDGDMVTFTFVDHKTEKPECLTLAAEDFMKLLIRHIPDNNFRVVRYYGFLANRVRGELLPKVFSLLGHNYRKAKAALAQLGSWWRRQLELFNRLDPLTCSLCLVPLALISVVYTTGVHDTYG